MRWTTDGASRKPGTIRGRRAAMVACALVSILSPATSAARDRMAKFLGTVQAVRLVRGRARTALQTNYAPTALVTVKIEGVKRGRDPFEGGKTVVLPMSRPEKSLGPLARAVGRTYRFCVTLKRARSGWTIDRIDADTLVGETGKGGAGIVLVGPPAPKPKPLPPEKRPEPGIYTRHVLVSSAEWLADACAGPDGLVYYLSNYRSQSCFGVFDIKKGRLSVLERGLRRAQVICSAGDRVYWTEQGTHARGWRDERLSSYNPRTGKTRVLFDDVPGAKDIAGGPGGEVYILQANCTLSVLRKGGTERATLARDINQPVRVAAGPKGDVFVLHVKQAQRYTSEVLRFPPGGGKREIVLTSVRDGPSGMLVGLATDTRGNLYLVYEQVDDRQVVTIRVLIGGDPQKAVPLSVDPAYDLTVLPNGNLLVREMYTIWLFEMKKKVEDLVRRR